MILKSIFARIPITLLILLHLCNCLLIAVIFHFHAFIFSQCVCFVYEWNVVFLREISHSYIDEKLVEFEKDEKLKLCEISLNFTSNFFKILNFQLKSFKIP